jgi:hypothetical protein
VAAQTLNETHAWSLVFAKGARGRSDEEQLVGQLILYALASAAGLDDLPALDLRAGETLDEHHATADPLLLELLAGKRNVVWSLPAEVDKKSTEIRGLTPPARPAESQIPASKTTGPKSQITRGSKLSFSLTTFAPPKGLLCGSFHPLHFGHEQLRAAAERQLGGPVYYEM